LDATHKCSIYNIVHRFRSTAHQQSQCEVSPQIEFEVTEAMPRGKAVVGD